MAANVKLYGVGTGPGDPELLTLKAARVLRSVPVISHFAKAGRRGNARQILDEYFHSGVIELPLYYPVTTELPRASTAYREQIAQFFDEAAEAVRGHLQAGRPVAVLSEGDPFLYGSYMHLHVRLAAQFATEVIPGVSAMSGCWSLAGVPIAQGDDVLAVLPGTLNEEELARRLADCQAAVIVKLGRNLGKVRRAAAKAGCLARAVYVERGTMASGTAIPLAEKADDMAPYFSLVLVPGWEDRA